MSEFKIATSTTGSNPANWSELDQILDANEPDWSYKPWQGVVILGDLTRKGIGYPSATWTWRGISEVDRETLRGFCASLSSEVYISTPTNESSSGVRSWINASAVMNWMDADEEKNVDHTLDFQIEFTKIVEV